MFSLRWLPLLLLVVMALFPIAAQAAPVTLTSTTLRLSPWIASYPPQCYDLRVEARRSGTLISTAQTYPLAPVCPYGPGINQVTLAFSPAVVDLSPGDTLELTYLTRLSSAGFYSSPVGQIQMWYNGPYSQTDTTVQSSLGTLHLAAGNQLTPNVVGPATRSFLPYVLHYNWQSFGTWRTVLP